MPLHPCCAPVARFSSQMTLKRPHHNAVQCVHVGVVILWQQITQPPESACLMMQLDLQECRCRLLLAQIST